MSEITPKKIALFTFAAALGVAAIAPVVAKAMEINNDNKPKLLTQVPPLTFTPNPTQIPNVHQTAFPTPYLLEIKAKIPVDIPFFSQLEPVYKQIYFQDGTSWSKVGCEIFAGAMLDRTTPKTYYQNSLDYFAKQRKDGTQRFSKDGSSYEDLIAVLTDKGHTFIELSKGNNTKFEDVRALIKKYTDHGIPVLVRGAIWLGNGTLGHMSVIVDVNENGGLVSNDSIWGKNYVIDESKYLEEIKSRERDVDSTNSLKVFAVYPPTTVPTP
ncbi:MAG TPA: hypothetical protein VKC53_00150 [Patescibacteria group bacterium]|nr:hypothetical protein [Patescibacteria group bacterium]